jgi:hypothetical protein
MLPPCLITVAPMLTQGGPGGIYFSTVNTYRRQSFLTDADVRSAVREAIGTLRSTHAYPVRAQRHYLW